MNFLHGIIFTILFLIASVFIRRYIRKIKNRRYKEIGGNSRESCGEEVVAVLSSGKDKKKFIKESWIKKMYNKLVRLVKC